MSLDRESIIKRRPLKTEKIHVDEWGGDVYVREMTGAERDWLDARMYDKASQDISLLNVPNYRAAIASLVLCDESGKRLFTEHDIPLLSGCSASSLEIVMKAGVRVNGMLAEAVEEAEKNFELGQSAEPGTD